MQSAEGGEEGGIDAFGAAVNEIQRAKYIHHTKPSMHPFNSRSAQRLRTKILNPPASWSYHSVLEVMKMMMLVFVFSRLMESCFTLTQNAVRLFSKKKCFNQNFK